VPSRRAAPAPAPASTLAVAPTAIAAISGLLVAPTEPRPLKALGTSSLTTERNGVDFLWGVGGQGRGRGLWGVQRKEVRDLLASLADGRLSRELGQMGRLTQAVLLIEGRLTWTLDGQLAAAHPGSSISRPAFRALLYSVQARGVWVEYADSLADTAEVLRGLHSRSHKGGASSLAGRPKPTGLWGTATSRDWAVHVLTSFEGVGPGLAAAILDHFGRLPLAWTVDAAELQQVRGLGKVRAARMVEALR